MEFLKKFQKYTEITEKGLRKYLPENGITPKVLGDAMRYSLFAGGKRLRPVILLASCEAFGGNLDDALPFACAMEMIHTYSLIHDDLPAMDNDDYRRGKPTNHKVFGEAVAILAGDGLLSLAFEIMSSEARKNPLGVCAMAEIAKGAGVFGMVCGQAADVINENREIDAKTLNFIHKNKTGAMIKAAFVSGGILGGANNKDVEKLIYAGENLGLGFQIQDDILDVSGDFEILGKPVRSDEKNNKSTFVALYGLESSRKMAEEAFLSAAKYVDEISGEGDFLKSIIKYVAEREC